MVGRLALSIIILQMAGIHPDPLLQTARCSRRGHPDTVAVFLAACPCSLGQLWPFLLWLAGTAELYSPWGARAFSGFSLRHSSRYQFLPEWRRVRNVLLKGVIFFTCSFIYFSEKLDWHGCTYSDFFGRILTVISIFFKQFLGCFGLSSVLLTCCI